MKNLFWNIGCYFLTLGGWNNLTNSRTYKLSIVQICFISYFTFIMRMEKKAEFSPCKRKFVCPHKMARGYETVLQLVNHILHGGHGEGKLPKFHHNLHLMFWKMFPAILCWPERKNSPFLLLLMLKVRSDAGQNLHNTGQIFKCPLCVI